MYDVPVEYVLRTFSKRPSSHDVMMRLPVAQNGVILDSGDDEKTQGRKIFFVRKYFTVNLLVPKRLTYDFFFDGRSKHPRYLTGDFGRNFRKNMRKFVFLVPFLAKRALKIAAKTRPGTGKSSVLVEINVIPNIIHFFSFCQ
jgi:hypothetical protein